MRYLVTINDQFEDDFGFAITEGDIAPETGVSQFLDQFTVVGNPDASNIWCVIAMYHEDTFPEDEPVMSMFIFAETVEDAKRLVKETPLYQEDIADAVTNHQPGFTKEELDQLDVIEYIFGDYGDRLSQCIGQFGLVPPQWRSLIMPESDTNHTKY